MSGLLGIIWSAAFGLGLLAGVAGMRALQWAQCRWLDKHHPKEDGTRHRPPPIAKQWMGGALTACVLVYFIVQTQQTQDRTVEIANRVGDCAATFQAAIKDRSDITAQDAALSNRLSDVRNDIDEATGNWVNRLLNPPPDIAALNVSDPRRQAWNVDVTTVYFQRTTTLRNEVRQIVEDRKELADQRAAKPLPDPQC